MSYSNDDLAPTKPSERRWHARNYAALWMGMSFSIPAYMLASSLIAGGLNWWQALLAVLIGNCIILVPMLLSSHAGTKYGIPFPVFARASFGMKGANIPAMVRALVACGWFGIQSWVGGQAIYQLLKLWVPGFTRLPAILPDWLGLTTGSAIAFLLFVAINIYIIYRGIDLMRKLLVVQSITMLVLSVLLIAWAAWALNGFHALAVHKSTLTTPAQFWGFFLPALTGIVGYFSTLCLNIPDFTRYAVSQRAQIIGQSISLPGSMVLITFIGVFVTTATSALFGGMVWNPVDLAAHIQSPLIVSAAMIAVIFITLVANVAANLVSPANDISHLSPKHISFKMGGYITCVVGVLICPWKLIASPDGYIFTWLTGTSGLLGAVVGIMLTDYYLLRKTLIDIDAIYRKESQFWYSSGFNSRALIALAIAVGINLPGFFVQIQLLSINLVSQWLVHLYSYAWFVSLFVASLVYYVLMKLFNPSRVIEMDGNLGETNVVNY